MSFSLSAFKPIVPDPDAGKFVLNYDPQYLRLWDSQDKGTSILPYNDWTGTLTGNAYSGEDTIWLEGFDSGISNLSVAWIEDGYDDGTVFDGSNACTCMCQVIVHGGNAEITTWGVDIDTDSNNNGEIDDYDQNGIYEDDIERTSAKRIFVNIDDDNRNGVPDKDELSDPTFVSDNDLAKTVLQIPVLDAYTGKKVRLTLDGNIRAWNALATSESSGVYEWVLDGVTMVSPGITVPTHSLFPLNIYIEGLEVGGASAKLEMLDGGVVMGAPDDVTYSVEKIVWPFENPPSGYQNEPTSDTSKWVGIELNEGWYIDKALVDYITNPEDLGTIETVHPDRTAPHESQPKIVKARADNDGELSASTESYPNGFRAEIEYEFPHRDVNGYVQALGKGARLSFVGNSGVKFGSNSANSNKPWEINILDVDALFAEAGGSAVLQAATDESGEVEVTTPDYNKEPVNRLMTAIVYGGEYEKMTDNPNYTTASEESEPPADAGEYHDTHLSNKERPDGVMVIDVKPVGATWSLVITLSGVETFRDDDFDPGDLSKFSLQSHWGSGVRFQSMEVTKYVS